MSDIVIREGIARGVANCDSLSSTLLRVLSIDKRKPIWYNISTDEKSEYIPKRSNEP